MRTTRRRFVQGTLAAAAVSGAPGIVRAQAPSRARTIRAVMQGDLRSLDPIWTTANITAYHGAMIYDTLFALDGEQRTKPQMVGKFGVSDDKLTHTFELRDGLKFSDGTAVTADDVVASIRRWAARDGGGQHMMRAREGHLEEGRQDLRDRAEGALWPRHRPDGEDRDADALHHAQEGSRDRPEPADHRIHRLRPVHLQSRRDPDGLALRLRPQSELRVALGACERHGRREDTSRSTA